MTLSGSAVFPCPLLTQAFFSQVFPSTLPTVCALGCPCGGGQRTTRNRFSLPREIQSSTQVVLGASTFTQWAVLYRCTSSSDHLMPVIGSASKTTGLTPGPFSSQGSRLLGIFYHSICYRLTLGKSLKPSADRQGSKDSPAQMCPSLPISQQGQHSDFGRTETEHPAQRRSSKFP